VRRRRRSDLAEPETARIPGSEFKSLRWAVDREGVVGHLLDVLEERLRGLEERLEV
jgi:hypothetical protein